MKDERRGASGGEKLTWSESVGDAWGLMSQLGHCDLLHTGEEGWPLCSELLCREKRAVCVWAGHGGHGEVTALCGW